MRKRLTPWLRKNAHYSVESAWGKKFLDDPNMPPYASRGTYEARMRAAKDYYEASDLEMFRKAWKAMLIVQWVRQGFLHLSYRKLHPDRECC